MQRNKIDSVDRGWESMHEILDREMPQKDKRRKFFLYWLTGGIAFAILLGFIGLPYLTKLNTNPSSDIAMSTAESSNLTDENNTLTSTIKGRDKLSNSKALANSSVDASSKPHQDSFHKSQQSNKRSEDHLNQPSAPTSSQAASYANELNTPNKSSSNNSSSLVKKQKTIKTDAVKADTGPPITNSSIPSDENSSNIKQIDPNSNNDPVITNDAQTASQANSTKATIPTHKTEQEKSTQTFSEQITDLSTDSETSQTNYSLTQPINSVKSNPAQSNPSSTVSESAKRSQEKNTSDKQETGIEATKLTELAKEETQDLNTGPLASKNTISLVPLLPKRSPFLTIPEHQVLALIIPMAAFKAPITTSESSLKRQWEFGLSGLYAHNATGTGFESLGGYRQELSKQISFQVQLGGGYINIPNTATLADLSSLGNQVDIETGRDGDEGPTDAEAPGPAEAGNLPQGDNNEFDIELSPQIPDLSLTSSQVRSLSLSNIRAITYLTANAGLQFRANRRIHIGANLGMDYVLNTSFNRVFIENDKYLTTEASARQNLTEVQLEEGTKRLPYTEAYGMFMISEKVKIKAGYKHYFKALYPALGKTWLNQIRMGVYFSLPAKNK